MGFLDKVERGLEKVVTSFFRGTSTASVKPVELTTALRNEMDRGILPISEGRSLAPNDFVVSLSEQDYETAKGWGSAVVNELARVTAEHATTQEYSVQSDIMIHFISDPSFKVGEMEINGSIKEVSSSSPASEIVSKPTPKPIAPPVQHFEPVAAAKTTAQPAPVVRPKATPAPVTVPKQAILEVDGQRYALHHHSIVLGRSASTDIPVDDSGISRQHLRVETRGESEFVVSDLGSTNGTYVDGKKISSETRIFDGSIINIGQTKIVFRLITPNNGDRA